MNEKYQSNLPGELTGLLIPNSTQIPNVLLDRVMPQVSAADWKLACFVARKTYGWHKGQDRISLRQFERGTGVSRKWVHARLAALTKSGLLLKTQGGHGDLWALNLDYVPPAASPSDESAVEVNGAFSTPAPVYPISKGDVATTPRVAYSVPQSGVATTPTKETNKRKNQNQSEDEDSPIDVSVWVCSELGKAGHEIRLMVAEALPLVKKRLGCRSLKQAAEHLMTAWQAYEASDQPYRYGFRRWVAEGKWADLRLAPARQALTPSQAQALQLARCAGSNTGTPNTETARPAALPEDDRKPASAAPETGRGLPPASRKEKSRS